MPQPPGAPRFRIQAVSQLTGVPATTLRAWERRYGFPRPSRTASAYRLYSERDIAQVERMRDLCAGGMAAAEAAALVLAAPEAGGRMEEPRDVWEQAAATIIDATRRFDVQALEEAVRQTLTLGPTATIYERVIGPVLRTTGEMWAAGDISVAQEHLATQILETTLRSLVRLVQPFEPRRTIVLGCFAEETHTLGLYGAAFLFAGWGYRTVILGMRTPPEAITHAVQMLRPDAVGLSLTMRISRGEARKWLPAYAAACAGTPWVLGGRGAPPLGPLVEEMGGLCVGDDLAATRKAVDSFLNPRVRR